MVRPQSAQLLHLAGAHLRSFFAQKRKLSKPRRANIHQENGDLSWPSSPCQGSAPIHKDFASSAMGRTSIGNEWRPWAKQDLEAPAAADVADEQSTSKTVQLLVHPGLQEPLSRKPRPGNWNPTPRIGCPGGACSALCGAAEELAADPLFLLALFLAHALRTRRITERGDMHMAVASKSIRMETKWSSSAAKSCQGLVEEDDFAQERA